MGLLRNWVWGEHGTLPFPLQRATNLMNNTDTAGVDDTTHFHAGTSFNATAYMQILFPPLLTDMESHRLPLVVTDRLSVIPYNMSDLCPNSQCLACLP